MTEQKTYEEKRAHFEELKKELGITYMKVYGDITPIDPKKQELIDAIVGDASEQGSAEDLRIVRGLLSSTIITADKTPENISEGALDDLIFYLEDRKAGRPNSKLILE